MLGSGLVDHHLPLDIERGGRAPQHPLDVLFQCRADRECHVVVTLPLGLQQFFRQRRPVVGRVRFGAEKRDRAGVAGAP